MYQIHYYIVYSAKCAYYYIMGVGCWEQPRRLCKTPSWKRGGSGPAEIPEPEGQGDVHPQYFGRSLNPISTKRADYAQLITTRPLPDFQTFRHPWPERAGRKLIRTSLWILRYMVKKALANGLLVSNKYGVVICAAIKTTVQSLKEWDLISFKNRAAETSHDNRYDMNGGTKRKRRFRTKKN